MGKIFELRTKYNGLKYLFGKPNLNATQSRSLKFLSEYEFEINHIKGKEKKVVDALSRRVHEMYVETIQICKSYLKDRVLEATKSYQHYVETKEKLQQDNLQPGIEDYELREDVILIYKGKVYILMVLKQMHNVTYVRHPIYQKNIVSFKNQ
jgi:hypothetical protein